MTDEVPFSKYTHLYKLQRLIIQGLQPEFPTSEVPRRLAEQRGLDSIDCALWVLMKECWKSSAGDRPSTADVRDAMLGICRQGGT